MSEPKITCPNCRTDIKLTESLAQPLIEATRARYEQALSAKDAEVAKRETALRAMKDALEKDKAALQAEIADRVAQERVKIAAQEAEKAKRLSAADLSEKTKQLADLQDVLREREAKLADAQKAQAELIRKQRELDDAKRELDLTVEKRVQDSLTDVRQKAKQEAEDALKLKVLEKEETISSMQRQIEDLKRRAEQGSQQLQGEALELELENLLRTRFSRDLIEPVAKGEFGGDVLQRVYGPQDQPCGTILWESKRTKNWSDLWLPKLRGDQRAAKAEFALLVTNALPKNVEAFDLIDGVWVAEPRCAIPVAIALRQSLIELATARDAKKGQQTKMELVYEYLTGPRFRHRVEAIVEKFTDMQLDLDRERKWMTKQWAKREQQIRIVVEATAGMYGDVQGIAGQALDEIEALTLPMIEADNLESVD
ncbi:DUF2130 domain-containing protein [Hyphomicrobium sp.]|uniref:DUF2130 domain-containing protein n=1 Tax=Hyphomicrobium sp. TaxID=82 RepID=UPI002B9167C9|nr:DUF2130 domain-containing protein [Hyphomicrobium sp.]HRN87883.1 DUF2130 domain-containing protein [Hyphomicrobium sp.]HRQ27193.1 DUF2130 domain-containing protein [Hyphomicrobium sp.]